MLDFVETNILSSLGSLFDRYGWWGVAAALIIENATGLMPSEIILGLAGWMLISAHQLSIAMIFTGGFYAALGSTLGVSLAYWAARLGGRPFIDRLARGCRIDPRHITRVDRLFQRWGAWTTLVGRLIPGIRTLVSIPAGLARMPFAQFALTTFAGAYIWCTLLIGAGYILGHEWPLISDIFQQYAPSLALVGLGALGIFVWIALRIRARSKAAGSPHSSSSLEGEL
jgi:membrane protein DedA with SNARE-associated domain